MASYKSQFNPPKRSESQTPYTQRAPSTRLPQRSTPTSTNSQIPTPNPPKLQKKKHTKDEQVYPSGGVNNQRAPVAKSITESPRRGVSKQSTLIPHGQPGMSIPRSIPQPASSRLPRFEVAANTRTPSLVSGSSASTIDSPRSNLLRRKPSSIGVGSGRQVSRTRTGSVSSQEEAQPIKAMPGGHSDPYSETVLGISLPPSSSIPVHSEVEAEPLETRLHRYEAPSLLATENLPPTPQYGLSASPSTRYSESPGPFSVTSTPTSMSSHSPGLALTTKAPSRLRQASPMQSRPPVTRRKPDEDSSLREQHCLSSVRESSTSSSSASTIRVETGRQKDKTPTSRLPAPPPSPPPQISSMYFTISHPQDDVSQPQTSIHRSPPSPKRIPESQAPPELAHLADPSQPQKLMVRRPVRPSRDGASEIVGLREPSPVIQSNITSFPSPHKRTSSSESRTGVATYVPSGKSRFGMPPKAPSRNPSPNPSLPSGFPVIARVPTRGPTPEVQSDAEKKRAKTLPTPTPSPNKTSKFGFFSRRAKTDPNASSKSDGGLRRKGPMAGTGHEGYGKYAVRGRSGSSTSGGSIGRSASGGTTNESLNRTPSSRKSSITSTTSADDFFLERLTPVVIRGTGSSELSRSPEPMQSGSSLDLVCERPSTEIRMVPNGQKQGQSSRTGIELGRPTLLPSAMSDPVRNGPPRKKMALGPRRPSDSEDDGKRSFLPSFAARRTSRRSDNIDGAALAKLPSPINTAETTSVKALDSAVSNQHSIAESTNSRSRADDISEGKEGNWLKPKKAAAQPKPSRKWNFFQRAQASPKVEAPAAEVPVVVARPPTSRSVAHYALMDAPNNIDLEDLEQIMQEADSTPEEPIASESYDSEAPKERTKEHVQSMLLPSPPSFSSEFVQPGRPASPKVTLRRDQFTEIQSPLNNNVLSPRSPSPKASPNPSPQLDLQTNASLPGASFLPEAFTFPQTLSPPAPLPSFPPPRPSRLPQVGRIPMVVSRRDRDRRPPSQSFSRPFVPDQPRPVVPSRTSVDSTISLLATAGPPEPFPVLQGLNALSHRTAIATISPSADESLNTTEFFRFPPRKDSELSYSSSSGIWSFPTTTGTAIIPEPGAPQSEDEVWNEYDDLIDEVLSPGKPARAASTGPSQGTPLHYAGLGANEENSQRQPPPEPLSLQNEPKCFHTPSNSVGSSTSPATTSLHLRRSRLLAVLHSAQTPTTPISMSEFLASYGERNLSVIDPVTGRLSLPSPERTSSGSDPAALPSSTRSSLPASINMSARQSKATLASTSDKRRDSTNPSTASGSSRYRDTRLIEMAEMQNYGLVSMADLRLGALMTSKWLSFGRVLFSPAHFELKDPAEDRVLVIDGLGKDWSHYCALTYPEATIYNLGPGPLGAPSATGAAEPWSTLRNHRHIAHPLLTSPFPFPRGFFATAVLRFPPALSSAIHRTILAECKRVLRPGGYLEMSVLDLDLVNMGNRARRAVRGLKVKMQAAEPGVSLRNVSDEVMGGLGRRGFVGCYRCFVGVPVAGRLPSAGDEVEAATAAGSSVSGSASGSSGGASGASEQDARKVSFSDLLTAQNANGESDDGIAEMVARVGRWWYSRCYESVVLPEAHESRTAGGNILENSIWRDEALIRECEKRGTSFRLLIGYAQKPVVGVRRTVSV